MAASSPGFDGLRWLTLGSISVVETLVRRFLSIAFRVLRSAWGMFRRPLHEKTDQVA